MRNFLVMIGRYPDIYNTDTILFDEDWQMTNRI